MVELFFKYLCFSQANIWFHERRVWTTEINKNSCDTPIQTGCWETTWTVVFYSILAVTSYLVDVFKPDIHWGLYQDCRGHHTLTQSLDAQTSISCMNKMYQNSQMKTVILDSWRCNGYLTPSKLRRGRKTSQQIIDKSVSETQIHRKFSLVITSKGFIHYYDTFHIKFEENVQSEKKLNEPQMEKLGRKSSWQKDKHAELYHDLIRGSWQKIFDSSGRAASSRELNFCLLPRPTPLRVDGSAPPPPKKKNS